MISDKAILYAENCPQEIKDAGDVPRHFIGEVKGKSPYLNAICQCQRNKPIEFTTNPPTIVDTTQYMELQGRTFITDDMIDVIVYWGKCPECQRAHWARSGPPFTRARAITSKLH